MDPLTHTLVGGAMARTRLGRSTRLAGAALLIGANLPDLDVLAHIAGADSALSFRRGVTHGPLALLVLPPLLTLALWAYDARLRRRAPDRPHARPGRLLGLAFLACLTHPLLDWLNTYGVRWLMPFDRRWYYGDVLFIIDPWLWLILGGAVFLGSGRAVWSRSWLLGLATSLIVLTAGDLLPLAARVVWFLGLLTLALLHRSPRIRERPAAVGLLGLGLAVLYVSAMTALSAIGSAWVRDELHHQGIDSVERLMVAPRPANPLRWDVVAETPQDYRIGSLRWLPSAVLELDPEGRIDRPQSSPLTDAARGAPGVRGAMSWMRFPFLEVEARDDGYTVHLLDARYARRRTRGFGSTRVELDRQLRIRSE